MNVYDFDKTIFNGDCEDYFFAWMFRKPGMRLYHINYCVQEFLFKRGLVGKTKCRESEYRFLRRIHDLDVLLTAYWDEHAHNVMDWYLRAKEPTDVIATGSPRFLMEPIVKRIGVTRLVATDMDPRTGKITGEFAIKQFKLAAFQKQFDTDEIDCFYGDDFDDNFLATYAKHAYAVHDGDQLSDWNTYFADKIGKNAAGMGK